MESLESDLKDVEDVPLARPRSERATKWGSATGVGGCEYDTMSLMKNIAMVALLAVAVVCPAETPWKQYVELTVRESVRKPKPHPRLLADAETFTRLRAATNALARIGRERVLFEADQIRRFQPSMRKLEGRRMLTVSQRTLQRVLALSMAYRLTGDVRYAARAMTEAETVCAFKDWNPSHFLDTAEMTLAVALAYDWLYDVLTSGQRETLRAGLLRHGLREKGGAPKSGGWVTARNNWGPVCHAGLTAGAIAVMEDEPALAEKILVRAITAMPVPLQAYAPDGGFPEGPGFYWGYSTAFAAVLIEAVERVCGTDFGLGDFPGVRATADYLDLMTGSSGLKFNYADAGISPRQDLLARRTTDVAAWWLAWKFNRPDALVTFEIPCYRAYCADRVPLDPTPRRAFQRLFPLTLLWLQEPSADVRTTTAPLCRLLDGTVPVAVQRSGWGRDAWYVGLKGGSPSASHGHMDAGSFVLDAKGVRWAYDLGSEDYHRMEQSGRNVWNGAQGGERWKVFRLGPASHNILRLNEGAQYANGRARFVSFASEPVSKAALDLSAVYPGVSHASRTGMLVPGGGYILEDAVEGLAKGAVVKWQMITFARVKTNDRNRLVLAQKGPDGDEVELSLFVSDRYVRWEVESLDAAPGPDESPNPGLTRVSFAVLAPEDGRVSFAVRFE